MNTFAPLRRGGYFDVGFGGSLRRAMRYGWQGNVRRFWKPALHSLGEAGFDVLFLPSAFGLCLKLFEPVSCSVKPLAIPEFTPMAIARP